MRKKDTFADTVAQLIDEMGCDGGNPIGITNGGGGWDTEVDDTRGL